MISAILIYGWIAPRKPKHVFRHGLIFHKRINDLMHLCMVFSFPHMIGLSEKNITFEFMCVKFFQEWINLKKCPVPTMVFHQIYFWGLVFFVWHVLVCKVSLKNISPHILLHFFHHHVDMSPISVNEIFQNIFGSFLAFISIWIK